MRAAVTRDQFLGGRLAALQPARGHHRAGLDAILLAALFSQAARGAAVDLGAGVGTAGFALAARAPAAAVTLAEREQDLVALAREALTDPANRLFAARIHIVAVDLLDGAARRAAGLEPGSFDHALMNPPYYAGGSVRASPKDARARAHVLDESGLDGWFRAAAALVAPGGSLAAILPASRLGDLIDGAGGRFGALAILPVAARPHEAAIRLLCRGIKGSRAPTSLLPPLVLHEASGHGFAPPVHALLAEGASLADIHSSWRGLGLDG